MKFAAPPGYSGSRDHARSFDKLRQHLVAAAVGFDRFNVPAGTLLLQFGRGFLILKACLHGSQ
jgi:hypothetical protein